MKRRTLARILYFVARLPISRTDPAYVDLEREILSLMVEAIEDEHPRRRRGVTSTS